MYVMILLIGPRERVAEEQKQGTDGNYLYEEKNAEKISAFDRFRMYIFTNHVLYYNIW